MTPGYSFLNLPLQTENKPAGEYQKVQLCMNASGSLREAEELESVLYVSRREGSTSIFDLGLHRVRVNTLHPANQRDMS